jgi:hypothetical protein
MLRSGKWFSRFWDCGNKIIITVLCLTRRQVIFLFHRKYVAHLHTIGDGWIAAVCCKNM